MFHSAVCSPNFPHCTNVCPPVPVSVFAKRFAYNICLLLYPQGTQLKLPSGYWPFWCRFIFAFRNHSRKYRDRPRPSLCSSLPTHLFPTCLPTSYLTEQLLWVASTSHRQRHDKFIYFSQSLQANSGTASWNKSRMFIYISFQIHHLLFSNLTEYNVWISKGVMK
jgi:hypothetical protein